MTLTANHRVNGKQEGVSSLSTTNPVVLLAGLTC